MSKGQPKTRKVEVFRPGTFRAMNGQEFTFSAEDVSEMAASYDPAKAPAPVVVGHPQHDDPAFGWVDGFEVNAEGVLVACLKELAPEFVAAVEDGRYRKVSMKFFPPDASSNPVPGSYYPRHLGFLGGAAPAVPGLAPVEFVAGDEDELIEVAFSLSEVAESTSSILRKLREFVIEKFSLEDADQAIPEYYIRWIEDAGKEPDAETDASFTTEHNEGNDMAEDAEFAARVAEIEKRELNLRHSESVSFADGLISKGKLLPVQKAGVVALLDALGGPQMDDVSFSDDGTEKTASPAQLLRDVLLSQPEAVPLGQTDLGGDPNTRNVAFASPDGLSVDPDDLALHQKAVSFQSQNAGVSYLDAVAAVQGG